MATQADVRRIALSLPAAEEANSKFGFFVPTKGKLKQFLWLWQERIDPKKPRVPNPGVIAVRVANLGQKELILASSKKKFFTEPHYDGYPAVLVRLAEVTVADLKVLIADSYECMTPAPPVKRAKKK